jgi:hypothetical protein
MIQGVWWWMKALLSDKEEGKKMLQLCAQALKAAGKSKAR